MSPVVRSNFAFIRQHFTLVKLTETTKFSCPMCPKELTARTINCFDNELQATTSCSDLKF